MWPIHFVFYKRKKYQEIKRKYFKTNSHGASIHNSKLY
jgi:hypothetical protein